MNAYRRAWLFFGKRLVMIHFLKRLFIAGALEGKPVAVKRRAILIGSLLILTAVFGVILLMADVSSGQYSQVARHSGLIVSCVVGWVLLRKGSYVWAASISMTLANINLAWNASTGSVQEGVHLFFLSNAIAALVIFDFRQLGLALFFALVPLGLFAYFFYSGLLLPSPVQNVPIEQVHIRFLSSFLVAYVGTVLCVVFLILLDKKSVENLRKSEEKISEQNELLVQTNEELDRFAYYTSHELKAPLQSIKGLIQIAKLTDNPAEIQECINRMGHRIEDLERFIIEITEYSRNSKGQVELVPVKLENLVLDVLESLKHQKEAASIQFEMAFDDEKWLRTDVPKLKVVLTNLISNAIKYQDPLKIKKWVKASIKEQGTNTVITVQDNGIGIAPEHHEKITQMFYRATEKAQGSGLGLYITSINVRKLEGQFSFESEPGQGSTFKVVLPQPLQPLSSWPKEATPAPEAQPGIVNKFEMPVGILAPLSAKKANTA